MVRSWCPATIHRAPREEKRHSLKNPGKLVKTADRLLRWTASGTVRTTSALVEIWNLLPAAAIGSRRRPPDMTQPASSTADPNLLRSWLFWAWIGALVAALGSLFFSEVMKLPPCTLCWYQRICLYPLVVLLPVGILRGDDRVHLYALPLVVIGLCIAVYHNLLYYGVIPQALSPCTAGVACNARQIDWLGFIGIPLLGLGAFVFLLVTLLMHGRTSTRTSGQLGAST
jgi:disulfide bond formation protein DsbB